MVHTHVAKGRLGLEPVVLADIVRRVVAASSPDRIILFGSAARREMGPDSGVDLLVVKAGVEHRGRLAGDIYVSLFGLEVPVDVVVVTPEDIEQDRHNEWSIIRPALEEGIEVYAADAS